MKSCSKVVQMAEPLRTHDGDKLKSLSDKYFRGSGSHPTPDDVLTVRMRDMQVELIREHLPAMDVDSRIRAVGTLQRLAK